MDSMCTSDEEDHVCNCETVRKHAEDLRAERTIKNAKTMRRIRALNEQTTEEGSGS